MQTRHILKALTYVALISVGFVMLIPFLWMVLGSFKTAREVMKFPPTFIPEDPTLANYKEVFSRLSFGRYYLNNIITTEIPTSNTVLTASMAGFGFAKYRFAGRGVIFWLILATLMIPYPVTIVPLYTMT